MIHPTAIVESGARLGANVQIGPGAYIAPTAVIGEGCILGPHAVVLDHVTLGNHCKLHAGAVIGDLPQDLSFSGEPSYVVTGDHCTFREGVTVHRGTKPGSTTQLGSHVFMMANSHVAHNCAVGDHVIMANGVLLAGHVAIGDRVFMGGSSAVHQFCNIGRLAMIGAMGAIIKDVPPFCITATLEASTVYGLNLIGLRRAGLEPAERDQIKQAFDILYRSELNVTQAKAALRTDTANPFSAEYADFLEKTTRGICRYRFADHASND